MRKIISSLLILVLCFQLCTSNSTANGESLYETKDIKLYSSLNNSYQRETLLHHNNKVYMKLDSLLKHTGYSCEYSKGDTFFRLIRNGKYVFVDSKKSELRYGDITKKLPKIIDFNGDIWFPTDPVFLYLNARCEIVGDTFVIIGAETTASEFSNMFHKLIMEELCTIQWGMNEDKWYYGATVACTTILDIIFNSSISAVITGQYEMERCRSILLNVMGEMDGESYTTYLQEELPDIIKNTKSYKNLDKYSKLEVDEAIAFLKAVNYAGDAMELLNQVEAIYCIHEFNIDLVENVVIKGSSYFGKSFKRECMYKASDEIIMLYKKEKTPINEFIGLAAEKGLGYIFNSPIDDSPLMIGMKLLIKYYGFNDKYDDFLTLKNMYLFQKDVENAFNNAMKDMTNKISDINTDKLDFMYDSVLLYIQIRKAADKILGIHADKVDENLKRFLSINKDALYLDDPDYLSNLLVTWEDVLDLTEYRGGISWPGRYDEYYTYNYYSNGSFSKDTYKEEYIPYIELYEDGTYKYNLNMYIGMYPLTGTWHVDTDNENIVHLENSEGISCDIIIEAISDSEIVLRGNDYIWINDERERSTSSYGDVYIKRDNMGDITYSKAPEGYPNYWAKLYLDLLSSAKHSRTAYGDILIIDDRITGLSNVRLFDVNKDNIPECFISNIYDDECYIYTVKDNNLLFLYDIYNVQNITIRENLKTNKEEIFLSGECNGSEFLDRLDIEDKYTFSKADLFTEVHDTLGGDKIEIYYYVNDIKTNKEDYKRALGEFENNYRTVKEILPYEVNIDYNSDHRKGINRFIDYLDDYIINQASS